MLSAPRSALTGCPSLSVIVSGNAKNARKSADGASTARSGWGTRCRLRREQLPHVRNRPQVLKLVRVHDRADPMDASIRDVERHHAHEAAVRSEQQGTGLPVDLGQAYRRADLLASLPDPRAQRPG